MLSRRTFIGLAGAALVGAYTSDKWLSFHPAVPVVRAPLDTARIYVYDLMVDAIDLDEPTIVEVRRQPQDSTLLAVGVAPMGLFRWCAIPGNELVFSRESSCEITPGGARWHVYATDDRQRRFYFDHLGKFAWLDARDVAAPMSRRAGWRRFLTASTTC